MWGSDTCNSSLNVLRSIRDVNFSYGWGRAQASPHTAPAPGPVAQTPLKPPYPSPRPCAAAYQRSRTAQPPRRPQLPPAH